LHQNKVFEIITGRPIKAIIITVKTLGRN